MATLQGADISNELAEVRAEPAPDLSGWRYYYFLLRLPLLYLYVGLFVSYVDTTDLPTGDPWQLLWFTIGAFPGSFAPNILPYYRLNTLLWLVILVIVFVFGLSLAAPGLQIIKDGLDAPPK